MGAYNTVLVEPQILKSLSNAYHDNSDSEMAHFLCIAQSSDLQFHVKHHAGVSLVTCRNSDGVDQIVVPKSGRFYKLLIVKLYVTPLAGNLGV